MLELACVSCKIPLTPDLSCGNCRRRYPIVDGVPVLVRDPEWHLAVTRAALVQQAHADAEKLREVNRLLALGWKRRQALARVAQAVARDEELARGWLATLAAAAPKLPDVPAGAVEKHVTGYTRFTRYAVADWSGVAESERTNELIAAAVRENLADITGPVVVVGAGTGRMAELIRGPQPELALDLSLPMALVYRELCRGAEIPMHAPMETNLSRVEDVCPLRPLRRAPGPPLDYVVADALQLPVRDRSLDAVVSVYFTDVVPLTLLLREVVRVLRPGGTFIHFGPLGYGFYQPDEMWTVEEIREQLEARGFTLHNEKWVPHVFAPLPGLLIATRVNAWSFAARSSA